MAIEPEDEQTTHLLNFDEQGSTLYMFDSRGRDTSALVAVDVETGSVRELAVDPPHTGGCSRRNRPYGDGAASGGGLRVRPRHMADSRRFDCRRF